MSITHMFGRCPDEGLFSWEKYLQFLFADMQHQFSELMESYLEKACVAGVAEALQWRSGDQELPIVAFLEAVLYRYAMAAGGCADDTHDIPLRLAAVQNCLKPAQGFWALEIHSRVGDPNLDDFLREMRICADAAAAGDDARGLTVKGLWSKSDDEKFYCLHRASFYWDLAEASFHLAKLLQDSDAGMSTYLLLKVNSRLGPYLDPRVNWLNMVGTRLCVPLEELSFEDRRVLFLVGRGLSWCNLRLRRSEFKGEEPMTELEVHYATATQNVVNILLSGLLFWIYSGRNLVHRNLVIPIAKLAFAEMYECRRLTSPSLVTLTSLQISE